jgi:hypothetical protein
MAGDGDSEETDGHGERDLGGLTREREGDRPRAQKSHQRPHARQRRNPAPATRDPRAAITAIR